MDTIEAKLEFCILATWKNQEIQEEHLFYDMTGMMKKLGLVLDYP
jgi:hypothetical protein